MCSGGGSSIKNGEQMTYGDLDHYCVLAGHTKRNLYIRKSHRGPQLILRVRIKREAFKTPSGLHCRSHDAKEKDTPGTPLQFAHIELEWQHITSIWDRLLAV